jgi:hypothetical protein
VMNWLAAGVGDRAGSGARCRHEHGLAGVARFAADRVGCSLQRQANQPQLRAEVARVHEPAIGILLQCPGYRVDERHRDVGCVVADRRRVVLDDSHHHSGRRVAVERLAPRHELVQHHTRGEHIGTAIDLAAGHLLGSHVRRAPQHVARVRHRRSSDLGNTEVQQLDRAVVHHPDVRGLDVAVHDPLLVGVMQAGAQLREHVQVLHQRERRRRDHSCGEAAAPQELHGDVRGPVLVLGELVDRDDVPVLQAGRSAGLAEEPGASGLVGREVARHQLDRDLAIEHGVLTAIEHSHAAASHALDDLVASNRCGRFHWCSCQLARVSSMTSS